MLTFHLKGVTVPVVKSFKLDNKDRKVYFVNDRSFAFMDDNVPRELTFEGPPKLVFIEGFVSISTSLIFLFLSLFLLILI